MAKNTALITGSTGGLGSAFVTLHSKMGGDVILVGRKPQKLEKQKNEVEKEYRIKAYTIVADFTDYNAAEVIYNKVR